MSLQIRRVSDIYHAVSVHVAGEVIDILDISVPTRKISLNDRHVQNVDGAVSACISRLKLFSKEKAGSEHGVVPDVVEAESVVARLRAFGSHGLAACIVSAGHKIIIVIGCQTFIRQTDNGFIRCGTVEIAILNYSRGIGHAYYTSDL